jgi:transaldolase
VAAVLDPVAPHTPASIRSSLRPLLRSAWQRVFGSEIDPRLDALATPQAAALRGRAAIANTRLAYAHHEQVLAGPRWVALAARGARPQRPLWASTGVKDPAYPDTRYVVDLVAPGVVNTMPEHTLRAVADHGEVVGDTIRDQDDDARQVLKQLQALGIDYDEVVQTLEQNAVAAFDASWTQLGAHLAGALRAAQLRRADAGRRQLARLHNAAADSR